MKRYFFSQYLASLVVAGFGLFLSDCLSAVTFSVTPLAVGNQYAGAITLQIGGLTNGETVVVQKFLDLNTNGVINASDWLVQQFNLTDGHAGMAIGGVTNFNVPGDTNTMAGQITAKLNFRNGDFMQNLVGKYLYKLSSPSGHFTPKTNLFSVTNFPYAQKFTGNVVSNGTSTTLPNAIVILCPPPGPGDSGPSGPPLAGAIANNSGSYTIQAPPRTYSLIAFKNNYVVNFSTPPVFTLSSGQTVTTNLTVANATSSISGKVVDANNASIGLPGILLSVQATNGLMGVGVTDTNGNFTVGVPSSPAQWWLGADISGLMVHGYLGLGDRTHANAGQTGVTLALPKATALFYGSVKDNLGNPLPGIEVYANDNNNDQYESDGFTDANGNYVAGALAGDWRVEISSDTSPTNYLLSQPDFGSNGGTNISANTAVQINFTALLVIHYISGSLKDSSGNPIVGVGVWAYATIDGVGYHQGSVDTDADGNYSLNVANGTWTVGVSSGGGDDSLPGNYLCPANQSVVIANNNATANFTALSATRHITGHVQQANSSPIGYVGVWASATINSVDYFQYVDADGNGNYSLNVANGSWTVGVNCGGGSDSLDAILGRGTYKSPGNQNVTINNDDGVANFTVEPLQPLQMTTTSPLPGGTVGVYYEQSLSAAGGQPPYWWWLPGGTMTLPPGTSGDMSYSSDGTNYTISGTPTTAGTFSFWVGVIDNAQPQNVLTQMFSITIEAGRAPGQLKWSGALNGGPIYYSSPAIGPEGTIYVGSGAPFSGAPMRGLYAVNPDGSLKWQYTGTNMLDLYTPSVGGDGTIYVQDSSSSLHAFNSDGTLKWKYPLNRWIEVGQTAPAIASDGTIYVGAETLYAINPDGTLKWRNTHNGIGYSVIRSSPAIATNGTVYFGMNGFFEDPGFSFGNALLALNPDGSLKWEYILRGTSWVFSSPAIGADGTIFIGAETSGDLSFVYAVNANGTLKWRYDVTGGRTIRSSPAIGVDGTIYIGTKAGAAAYADFLALNPNGTLKWKYSMDVAAADIYCSPAIGADGTIYFGAETWFLYALNPDGSLAWKYSSNSAINWTSPAIDSKGTIYIGNNEGNLFAINSSSMGLASSPWPKFRHDNWNTGYWTTQEPNSGPLLHVILTSTNTVAVSWPAPSTGFVLQQNADLGATNWIAPSETINDNGTTKSIIVNPPTGNRFYRLFHP
jgi:outer membrane protein assembly factor BamB